MPELKPMLELKGICKSFGNFKANDQIDLKIYPGEVHAVLGENGAGKSTLMNIIYGMYQQDEGSIEKDGKTIYIKSPRDAMKYGIGMVHQHYMLVNVYSAAENVFLMGNDPWWKLKNDNEIESTLDELGKKYGLEVDVHSPIGKLSIGMQQRIEILKLLYIGADLLILDEPTAVLLPQECNMLFDTIEVLVKHGKSIIFISHKLDEVMHISQRITVLSKGKVEGEMMTKNADKSKIIKMMVGSDMEAPILEKKQFPDEKKEEVVRLKDVKAKDERGVSTLNGVSFSINKGEIVGIASMEGNGQAELAEVITGVRKVESGKIYIRGTEISTITAKDFIDNDIAYVPSDRNEVGTVKDFPIYENWILRSKEPPKKHKLLDYLKIKEQTKKAIDDYDVRTTGINARTGNLSGGNLQKLILARELNKMPQAIVCSYPTRGLDIKASWFIRAKVMEMRDIGIGVLLISGDMEELFALADRLIVLYRGEVVAEVLPQDVTVYDVGRMMMGVRES